MWFTSSITVIGEALKSLFDLLKVNKEKQIETTVIKDKKDIEDANEDALKALKIASKYLEDMSFMDRVLFKRYYNNFLEDK